MAMAVGGFACEQRQIADNNAVYYKWDGERVLCGAGIDDRSGNDVDNIREALSRARDRQEVLVLYAHDIADGKGAAVSPAKLGEILAFANELDLRFVTFAELAASPRAGGGALALTFDDTFVDHWYAARSLFAEHGAKVTFFVARVDLVNEERIAKLHELMADGHAIESHSKRHLDAVLYAEEHGAAAWRDSELVAGLEDLRRLGFSPTTFAYPYGARTSQLDRVALEQVSLVRSLSYFYDVPLIADPCPR